MTRDLRRYQRQTIVRLVLGFLALLVVVGSALVYFIYGRGALASYLLCLSAALAPLLLVLLFLFGLQWLAKVLGRER